MTSTEIRINRLIPEKYFPVPVNLQLDETTASDLNAQDDFKIIHFNDSKIQTEEKKEKLPMLLPEPPVSFLRPRKYDYY